MQRVTRIQRFRFVNHTRVTRTGASILLVLIPMSVLSQVNSGGSSSLRGSAKIEDKFVAEGIMIVVVPTRNDGSLGRPRPALVGKDGEYRIEELNPGPYTLKASGTPIKPKELRVKIVEGNVNVQNITLERADQPGGGKQFA